MGSGPDRGALSRGRFLTLEGGEGSGKTTQALLLQESLARAGVTAVITREPGGTPGAEDIRRMLVAGEAGRWQPLTEALLYFAARSENLKLNIGPMLNQGVWVICDRFTDSTVAYQGAAMGVGMERVHQLAALVLDGLAPDLTLVLDVDVSAGLAREDNANGEDRYADMGTTFHQTVRKAFLEITACESERCRLIDASGGIEFVRDLIWTAVAQKFGL